MKTFEQFNDIDPYGEENWGSEPVEIDDGYYSIRILFPINVDLSYGGYDDHDDYVEKYSGFWELQNGEVLNIDIYDQDEVNIYFTADTGDDYVAKGQIPKGSFEIMNIIH